MSRPFWLLVGSLAVAMVTTLSLAWCIGACGASLPVQAEASYGAEIQACVVQAKLQDSGRAGSKQCEREVDYRWHIVTDGGAE